MDNYIALVVYGCTVGGKASDSVDIQARIFESKSIEDVDAALKAEKPNEYKNEFGELVSWPLATILDIQPLEKKIASGNEIAGAITDLEWIAALLPKGSA